MVRGTPHTVQAQSGHHVTNILLIYTGRNVLWARITQSVQRLAMGWTVQVSNPGGGQDFLPWGPPSLVHSGNQVFPGGKVAGVCCLPPTPI
jgi:hypothetical protein